MGGLWEIGRNAPDPVRMPFKGSDKACCIFGACRRFTPSLRSIGSYRSLANRHNLSIFRVVPIAQVDGGGVAVDDIADFGPVSQEQKPLIRHAPILSSSTAALANPDYGKYPPGLAIGLTVIAVNCYSYKDPYAGGIGGCKLRRDRGGRSRGSGSWI